MTENSIATPPNRCRLVLIIDGETASVLDAPSLTGILKAADVASVIFTPGSLDETTWQPIVEPLIPAIQSLGIAAIIAGYSRIAGRVGADGLQLGQDPTALKEAIEKFSPKLMVGAANVKTRHTALTIGELEPDYLMFGKPGTDTRPEPHPKNVTLGAWWSDMVEIPAITLGGTALESVIEISQSGVEFVALGAAIFAPHEGAINLDQAPARIEKANQLLNDHAPTFDTYDA